MVFNLLIDHPVHHYNISCIDEIFNDKLNLKILSKEINVIDTIGAGDTFAAALIAQLLEKSWTNENALKNLSSSDLTQILTNCSMAAAITCSSQGCFNRITDQEWDYTV